MSTNYTNQKKSPALNGAAVLVTLNSSDAASLYLVREGQLATNSGNSKTGTVSRVNIYGNSFEVSPIQPNFNFDSAPTLYGYLNTGETISVAT